MALDIYFREDLANILASAEVASQATAHGAAGSGDYFAGYRAGYRAALIVVAQALGLRNLPVLSIHRTAEGTQIEP